MPVRREHTGLRPVVDLGQKAPVLDYVFEKVSVHLRDELLELLVHLQEPDDDEPRVHPEALLQRKRIAGLDPGDAFLHVPVVHRGDAVEAVSGCLHGRIEQLVDAASLYRDQGIGLQARQGGERRDIDLHALFLRIVDHVEPDDHGHVHLHELQRELKGPGEQGCVHDIDDHVHLAGEEIIPRHPFRDIVGGNGVGSGQIDEPYRPAADVDFRFGIRDRGAREVSGIHLEPCHCIENGRFPAVRLARQGDHYLGVIAFR